VTLQPLVLDDLDWERMVQAIRRRVPAESGGTWTLHSPVDPGITLLELFAYLLEQRLFSLDQVPDALVLAVLRLLGLDDPKPARAAGTVLRLRAGQPGETPPALPEGTVFARDPQQQVAFTVTAATTVLPVDDAGIRLWAGGRERTADLAAQRPVPLLAPGAGPAEARILLPLSGNPAADARPAAGSALSLLIRIASPDECPAAWLPTAASGVQPPADLVWSWYLPDAADPSTGADLPAADPQSAADGTAGLRRSGVLRLPLPAAWCDGVANPAPAAYGLRVSTAAATFSVAPALLQLVPNTAPATHQRKLRVTGPDVAGQTRAWLRLPGQHLDLPGARGTLLSAKVTITRDGIEQEWTAVPDRTATGPANPVFVLDRETGSIRFGDGLNGAIPVPDADPATGAPLLDVEYTVGGGVAGNGGLTSNWTLVQDPGAPPGPVATAENVVPAEDGLEPETIARVRARIGDSLAEVTRAVTAADYRDLATTTPGVAVASCYVGPGEHPRYPCKTVPGAVTVRVVPGVADPVGRLADDGYDAALQPDPGTLDAVTRRLAPARLLGTELFVRPPRYRPVALRVDLSGAPADPAGVRATVRAALRHYLDPLQGGDGGDGWPFGEPLRPSALLRATQAALGDLAQVEKVAIGVDGAPPSGGCDDVPIGTGWLPALSDIQVATVAGAPGEGLS
jgi:predicted phage baseplate assembly protein